VMRIEEIASGKMLRREDFPRDFGARYDLSADGRFLAIAAGLNTRSVYLWKWQEEKPRQLKGSDGGEGIQFSPDGKLLAAVGTGGNVHVWEVPEGRTLYQHECPEEDYAYTGTPVFTPDGTTLALALRHRDGFAGRIHLVEPRTARPRAVLETFARMFAVSADSRLLAALQGDAVRIWDLASGKELAGNEAHSQAPAHIVVGPSGLVVTAGHDASVRLWDSATGRQLRKWSVGGWVRAIGLSPDARMVAASSMDDAVYVWDTRTGQEIYRLAGHGRLGGRRTLAFLAGGGLLSWGDDFYLRAWDLKNGKARLEHAIRPSGVTIPDEADRRGMAAEPMMQSNAAQSPDGKTFALDIAGNFHVFDTATGKEKLKFPSAGGLFGAIAISPDGQYLLAGTRAAGNQSALSLRELATGKVVRLIPLPGSSLGPVAFAADSRSFATANEIRGQILVYEVAGGGLRRTITGIPGQVRALAFLPDGRRLAAGLSDSTAMIWDLSAP
jgi:WD40 repeat protein